VCARARARESESEKNSHPPKQIKNFAEVLGLSSISLWEDCDLDSPASSNIFPILKGTGILQMENRVHVCRSDAISATPEAHGTRRRQATHAKEDASPSKNCQKRADLLNSQSKKGLRRHPRREPEGPCCPQAGDGTRWSRPPGAAGPPLPGAKAAGPSLAFLHALAPPPGKPPAKVRKS
jgi:hypothetical protein